MADAHVEARMATPETRKGKRTLRAVVSGFIGMTLLTTLVISAPPAHADVYVGTSFYGTLFKGQYITDPTGAYKLIMQTDGNLVLYQWFAGRWVACWGSGTQNNKDANYATYYRYDQVWGALQIGPVVILGSYYGHPFSQTNVDVSRQGVLYVAYTPVASCNPL